jgi:hypothetical protein
MAPFAQRLAKLLSPHCASRRLPTASLVPRAGNPQVLGQKPITFFRQVLSICDYPEVMSAAGWQLDPIALDLPAPYLVQS